MVFDYLKELAGVGEGKKEAEKYPDKGVVVADTPTSIPTKEESKEAGPKTNASSWLSLDSWIDLDGLKKGLQKTRTRIESNLHGLLSLKQDINEDVIEELEAALIEADMGVKFVTRLINELRDAWESGEVTDTAGMKELLKTRLKERFKEDCRDLHMAQTPPTVIMVAGVNGSGKTTSIAKLGNMLVKDGKKVLLAAGDTFRAAATEQLEIWSGRIGAQIVKHGEGADPAAVAYDAVEAAVARGMDIVIVDTAGRLHTKQNLMQELGKIKRVLSKRIEGAPHEVLMVLDATTGQNAISQAKLFKEVIDVTGLFLAKVDGTAKGGIVIGMQDEVKIPVKFLGLGEGADDIQKFDPDRFVDALFD
ncbi:MAG TPA: signal recognition particle-docking protein FtsY [Candidatus Avalokitesvara rifleensis]|uniref:signal recognition particle-docking protein FtsY n=1 Tax=Candidatus Avalokitesvara rifleensis TaxID=3367620 RepID=UPI00271348F4|nr:signal recognition particle-docking protein FtsY [Candidatus Brocadiales bacterium]